MREHWISTTRKLNRHYQSGNGSDIILRWEPRQVNADHTLAWGVDTIFNGDFIAAAPGQPGSATYPMPLKMQNASQFEFIPFLTRENGTSGDVYIPYMRITVTTEDAQGNTTNHLLNWYCPSANPTPSGQWIPYTALNQQAFTNLYNNAGMAPLYGEKFSYDSIENRYKLTTRFIIRKSDFTGAVKFVRFSVTAGLMQSERLTSTQKVYLQGEIKKV